MKIIFVIFCLLLVGCASQKELTCNERYKETYLGKCFSTCVGVDGDWCHDQCIDLANRQFCK